MPGVTARQKGNIMIGVIIVVVGIIVSALVVVCAIGEYTLEVAIKRRERKTGRRIVEKKGESQ